MLAGGLVRAKLPDWRIISTAERIDRFHRAMATLKADGTAAPSAAEIAEECGTGRNQIIGLAHRNKLELPGANGRARLGPRGPYRAREARAAPPPKAPPPRLPPEKKPQPQEEPLKAARIAHPGGVPFLQNSGCRAIISGEVLKPIEDVRCCGGEIPEGSLFKFCAAHQARYLVRPGARR